MPTPPLLFKYRAGSAQDITNLSSAKLWFSRPAYFNDPFDCSFDAQVPQLSRPDCVEILRQASNGRFTAASVSKFEDSDLRSHVSSALKSVVDGALSRVGGVCCFAGSPDNLLMWGHYSNGHRGFCLEFDTTREPLFKKAHKVKYRKEFPSLAPTAFTKWEFSQILDLLLSKSDCWEYEGEWRVLHDKGDFAYSYSRASLKAIYFRAKMQDDEILMIASLLERTDTKLYRMALSKTEFRLAPVPLAFTRLDYRS